MSYVSSYFHCVFSAKQRRPLIAPELRDRLWPFLGGVLSAAFLTGLERGCVEDQPQHARNVVRLTLRAQPRSDGMLTNQSSGEKCGLVR